MPPATNTRCQLQLQPPTRAQRLHRLAPEPRGAGAARARPRGACGWRASCRISPSRSSGHWYFSLKDRDAQVRCAMFRLKNARWASRRSAGTAGARARPHQPLRAARRIPADRRASGGGRCRRAAARVRAPEGKLAAEGLFALERKRSLPRFPRRIGVVTSPSGAALRDMLQILARRYPPAAVLRLPGASAGRSGRTGHRRGVRTASARAECDVLILARGGGSLEDLWAFNDERVARAIRACAIPVVSGVGHEIDFTIADFVADARAPTPSGAAELVAPDRIACLEAWRERSSAWTRACAASCVPDGRASRRRASPQARPSGRAPAPADAAPR